MAIMQFIQTHPIYAIIIISSIVTFISTMLTKHLTDQSHLRELKARQKELKEKMNKHKDNPSVMSEIQSEMLQISMTMAKSSFKPFFITAIPFLILFYWMSGVFGPLIPGKWLFPHWVWYYLVASVVSNIFFRKVMNVV